MKYKSNTLTDQDNFNTVSVVSLIQSAELDLDEAYQILLEACRQIEKLRWERNRAMQSLYYIREKISSTKIALDIACKLVDDSHWGYGDTQQ